MNGEHPNFNPMLDQLAKKRPAVVVSAELSAPTPKVAAAMEAARIPEVEASSNPQREVRSHRRKSLGRTAMDTIRHTGERVASGLANHTIGRVALWLYKGNHTANSSRHRAQEGRRAVRRPTVA